MKDMINGRDGYPPFIKKPPFKNWEDFKKAIENFFLTEETQHEAIIKIQRLKQTSLIEDYVLSFKSLAMLTNFSGAALVMQFQIGINPNLGRDIIKYKAPRDNDIEAWYEGALALGKHIGKPIKSLGDETPGQTLKTQTCSRTNLEHHNNKIHPKPHHPQPYPQGNPWILTERNDH